MSDDINERLQRIEDKIDLARVTRENDWKATSRGIASVVGFYAVWKFGEWLLGLG